MPLFKPCSHPGCSNLVNLAIPINPANPYNLCTRHYELKNGAVEANSEEEARRVIAKRRLAEPLD